MRVLITGVDGYLGWPLALRLKARGHEVAGIDNFCRRSYVTDVGAHSAIPIAKWEERLEAGGIDGHRIDLCNYDATVRCYMDFAPEAIVYLGEIPSAPWSMTSPTHAAKCQMNNVLGTLNTLWAMRAVCPRAHLIKLGTMGEYGTPSGSIPEAGPHEFPRSPGSFYHASKCHDSTNVEFACRTWGLRSTDVMQGVVYGTRTEELTGELPFTTRCDVDSFFGTVVHRFCAQALLGLPITPYGAGTQIRSFLPLEDSMQCLEIALNNPPAAGEYRVFNQFAMTSTIIGIARSVQSIADKWRNEHQAEELRVETQLEPIDNPRFENEQHEYDVVSARLPALGYVPNPDFSGVISQVLGDMITHEKQLQELTNVLAPQVYWR